MMKEKKQKKKFNFCMLYIYECPGTKKTELLSRKNTDKKLCTPSTTARAPPSQKIYPPALQDATRAAAIIIPKKI
jgi:hypothetical protein